MAQFISSLKQAAGKNIGGSCYYPFGLTMSGISSKALAFGGAENKKKYQGYEYNTDFDLNLYESFYRTHDPQIGRFWQVDPKPAHFESLYAAMGNNPIRNTDFLGDELSGTDRKSAERELEIIKNSIKGGGAKGAQDLFKLKGMKFNKISDKKLQAALSKIDNKDTKKLVEGYAKAINSKDKMFVSVVNRNEQVTITNKEASKDFSDGDVVGSPGSVIGRLFDEQSGGGRTVFSLDGKQSLSVIVLDSQSDTKYTNAETGATESQKASPGEAASHEILGHGLGKLSGSSTYEHQDAIQMSNLYRRSQGDNNLYRTGAFHPPGGILSKSAATGIPLHLQ